MLADAFLPSGVESPESRTVTRAGVSFSAVRWTQEALSRVAAALAGPGASALASVSDGALLDAWSETVDAFLDPFSPERQELDPALARLCGLSPQGLEVGLEAVLGGVRRRPARDLLARARGRSRWIPARSEATQPPQERGCQTEWVESPASLAGDLSGGERPPEWTELPGPTAGIMMGRERLSDWEGWLGRSAADLPVRERLQAAGGLLRPALVVLASNLPALAVQPLLPLLALRRPVLLKSPSVEPLFAPAFLAALARREPALGLGTAALTWKGGDEDLETAVFSAVGPILAYGDEPALASLARRAPGRLIGYGPKTSLAVLGRDVEITAAAEALARDVALFDQRGCLSVAAVYTGGDAKALADRLAGALDRLALRWPPGLADPATMAAVQQVRLEADLRGLHRPPLPLDAGTVVVDPDPTFRPTPGLRTVRIHPLPGLDRLPGLLMDWSGRLQGAALAGDDAWALADSLTLLGLSRLAAPGDLQSPDAAWHNGGIDPLEALTQPS